MEFLMSNGTREDKPQVTLVDPLKQSNSPSLTMANLVSELPHVNDGQISLADLLSRVVQAVYAEMTEFAETMPQMSDAARKRTIADFCVRTKKQVAKLYAVMKWARDADIVQKCMNITAFLMDHNQQLLDSVAGLNWTKETLAPAQLRNHDLLTSIDVLTTGTYRRLPTTIKLQTIAPPRMTTAQTSLLLSDLENVIRYRLRVNEPLPVELSNYTIWNGRVTFAVPQLFSTTLSLRGALETDGWNFLHVEFLFDIGGGVMSLQEFPRQPSGVIKAFIEDAANARLGYYSEQDAINHLSKNVVDAPLIRLYNFLQMMSLSYQLETLHYQALRRCALGWVDFLHIEMATDRKSFKSSYWIRRLQSRNQGLPGQSALPTLGGVLEISLRTLERASRQNSKSASSDRLIAEADQQSKAAIGKQPSDAVERLKLGVRWNPVPGALGISVPVDSRAEINVDSQCIDFEAILRKVIRWHSCAILTTIREELLKQVFSSASDVRFVDTDEGPFLSVHITCEEIVNIAIDPRTGRFLLQDTGDLSSTVRGPRFTAVADRINEQPSLLAEAISRFRYTRILDAAEQKASYLGFRTFRQRNLKQDELVKFGSDARSFLFIQLALFPSHYLVLVIGDDGYKFALIAIRQLNEGPNAVSVMEDIGWLDLERITHNTPEMLPQRDGASLHEFSRVKRTGFDLSSRLLKELYMYCCARVSHLKVEQQLKESGYIYSHVHVSQSSIHASLSRRAHYSAVTRAIPALCVKSTDILAGAEAADAVDENVRVMPLSWWGSGKTQVLTCVKLKHLQLTLGKTARTTPRIIRSSKTIMYDTQEGIISVLSPGIHGCILHFLSEWTKVSKMVIMAREVYHMAQQETWRGVTLLTFDLQTVEFTYASGFALAITCRNEASSSPAYTLNFFRSSEHPRDAETSIASTPCSDSGVGHESDLNPHSEINSLALKVLSDSNIAKSIRDLVGLLRLSLPLLLELEAQRVKLTTDVSRPHWCPKGTRWWRFFFPNLRHALDFRIRKDSLLEIVDGARSHITFASLHTEETQEESLQDLMPIAKFADLLKQLSLWSSVHVVSTDTGMLMSCSAPHTAIRELVGVLIGRVHALL